MSESETALEKYARARWRGVGTAHCLAVDDRRVKRVSDESSESHVVGRRGTGRERALRPSNSSHPSSCIRGSAAAVVRFLARCRSADALSLLQARMGTSSFSTRFLGWKPNKTPQTARRGCTKALRCD